MTITIETEDLAKFTTFFTFGILLQYDITLPATTMAQVKDSLKKDIEKAGGITPGANAYDKIMSP